ncbi:MAG: hypothetical protein ACFBSE_08900 [Prochloraceae cyanobacterium]
MQKIFDRSDRLNTYYYCGLICYQLKAGLDFQKAVKMERKQSNLAKYPL